MRINFTRLGLIVMIIGVILLLVFGVLRFPNCSQKSRS